MNDTTTQRSASAAQPLKDKVSLVTGSTSGIGLGIARALAAEGSAVVLNGFGKPEEIEAAKVGIETDFGVSVHYSAADMSNPEFDRPDVRDGARRVRRRRYSGQQCRHPARRPPEEFPVAKWDAILAINLQLGLPHHAACTAGMVDKGWGRIINIASAHGLVARPSSRPMSPPSTAWSDSPR